MFGALQKLFRETKRPATNGHGSGLEAKSRLTFCLSQDRSGLNGEEMSRFKKELISLIGRYFVIDENKLDISYERNAESTTLEIYSPVVVRRDGKSESEARPARTAASTAS